MTVFRVRKPVTVFEPRWAENGTWIGLNLLAVLLRPLGGARAEASRRGDPQLAMLVLGPTGFNPLRQLHFRKFNRVSAGGELL